MSYSQNPQESQTRTPAKYHGTRTLGVLGVHPTNCPLNISNPCGNPMEFDERLPLI